MRAAVSRARRRGLVSTSENVRWTSAGASARAARSPASVSSMSVKLVWRIERDHSVSPWRTSTRRGRSGEGGGTALADVRVVHPAAVADEGVGLGRPPRTALVGVDGTGVVEGGLHDAPGLLDDVLSGEAAEVAGNGVADEPLVGLLALAQGGGEVDRKVHRLAVERLAWRLGLHGHRHAVVAAEAEAHEVAPWGWPALLVEQQPGRFLELDDGFGGGHAQGLARPHVERRPRPPPRIDVQAQRGEGLGVGLRSHAGLVAVALVLAPHEGADVDRAHGGEDLGLLVRQLLG